MVCTAHFSKGVNIVITPMQLFLLSMTSGGLLILLPLMSISKANKFYQIAKKEGRTRGSSERKSAPVEEEYRTDAIVLTLCTAFTMLILSLSFSGLI